MPGKKVFIYLFCFVALLPAGIILILRKAENNRLRRHSERIPGPSIRRRFPTLPRPRSFAQIYDALYQNAYLDRPYRVVPALAADYPRNASFLKR